MKIETQIEYMLRHLQEYRAMKPEIVVPMQRMFPGCAKYDPCCDAHWNAKLENVDKVDKEYLQLILNEASKRKWMSEELKYNKAPEGFDKF